MFSTISEQKIVTVVGEREHQLVDDMRTVINGDNVTSLAARMAEPVFLGRTMTSVDFEEGGLNTADLVIITVTRETETRVAERHLARCKDLPNKPILLIVTLLPKGATPSGDEFGSLIARKFGLSHAVVFDQVAGRDLVSHSLTILGCKEAGKVNVPEMPFVAHKRRRTFVESIKALFGCAV
eukprot:TRINITY_DN282_c0_g1_i4.p1 TRINITY_DN282_c0_g1~~TRINITY_DN282_c0_g1_i4.p1  ORF type:complete len:213 (-),score=41.57 TRINITY_DN282_c0_g1_i4:65-610(-)